uniref:Ras-associating domain-containing protein n=1 Tax=Parascaris equorum TaxID=6256 RepID=A0A914S3B8_PAREQ
MDLLRINGFSTSEIGFGDGGNCRLLDVEVVLDRRTNKDRIRQYALICSEQCYVIRQVDEEPSNVFTEPFLLSVQLNERYVLSVRHREASLCFRKWPTERFLMQFNK